MEERRARAEEEGGSGVGSVGGNRCRVNESLRLSECICVRPKPMVFPRRRNLRTLSFFFSQTDPATATSSGSRKARSRQRVSFHQVPQVNVIPRLFNKTLSGSQSSDSSSSSPNVHRTVCRCGKPPSASNTAKQRHTPES